MPQRKFAVEVGCSDGRCRIPGMRWCMDSFDARFADRIALPGVVGFIAHGIEPRCSVVKDAVHTLVKAHNIDYAVVVAHAQCAGNPIPDDEHRRQIGAATRTIYGWGVIKTVQGVFIYPRGNNGSSVWRPQPVASFGVSSKVYGEISESADVSGVRL